ncbi:cytochrome P450 [Lyophyllum atratum]|nr:cytochrome P450 [Lyophyllum atratum]
MYLALILFIGVFFYLWSKLSRQRDPPFPPGPPADPLVGHLRLIPSYNQGTFFYELGKIYGDVMYLHVLGKPIIVLNSVEAAVDLLDKRSANYSDRPPFVVLELMGWVKSLVLMRYGKVFQKHRKMLQDYLNRKQCLGYQPIQIREARVLLQNLLSDQERREDFLSRFATSIVMRVGAGHRVDSDDDPYISILQGASHAISNAGSPGNTPVDIFPMLQYLPSWFPGTYYATFARENKAAIEALHEYPYTEVRKSMADGTAKPSFLSHKLETLDLEGPDGRDTVSDIKGAMGVMYCAGADTTWSNLSFFIFAMLSNPEAQTRAQKEIDEVVGSRRLPDFGDRSLLPYVECVLQESMRWNSSSPLGVPHRSMEDDTYRGMFIPKGSVIIANTRGMTLDERIYRDPHSFNPSRYLPKPEGNGEPYPSGPFGFGRRMCPGFHLADASLWIAMVSILATFTISKAVGKDGMEITPELSVTSGITSQPNAFQCRIRPRNEQAKSLIIHADTSDDY